MGSSKRPGVEPRGRRYLPFQECTISCGRSPPRFVLRLVLVDERLAPADAVVARFVVLEAEVRDVVRQCEEEIVVAIVARAEERSRLGDEIAVGRASVFGVACREPPRCRAAMLMRWGSRPTARDTSGSGRRRGPASRRASSGRPERTARSSRARGRAAARARWRVTIPPEGGGAPR